MKESVKALKWDVLGLIVPDMFSVIMIIQRFLLVFFLRSNSMIFYRSH